MWMPVRVLISDIMDRPLFGRQRIKCEAPRPGFTLQMKPLKLTAFNHPASVIPIKKVKLMQSINAKAIHAS